MKAGVIRARVHLEYVPSPAVSRPKPSAWDALGTLLLLGMVGVTGAHALQALIHGEAAYLALAGLCALPLLGAIVLLVAGLALTLAFRRVTRRLSHTRPGETAARLAAESDAGEHGEPVSARGADGWLTGEGIILATGRHIAWKRVLDPDVVERGDQVWMRAQLRPSGWLRLIYLAMGYGFVACLALGAVASAVPAIGLLAQRGFRYDLAAVLAFDVLLLMISGFGLTFTRHLPAPGTTRMEIAVLRSRITRDDLQHLVDRYRAAA